ncbi:MAG: signal recognition particle-docking protein FtsY [Burkholderiales bacterium]|nr:MAG: signal recognition particle-docking protein FtsY [Burkholderiales bacterium]
MWGWLKKKFGDEPQVALADKAAEPNALPTESSLPEAPVPIAEIARVETPNENRADGADTAETVEVTPTPAVALAAPTATDTQKTSWFDKLKTGLSATRNKLGLQAIFASKLDEDTLEQLEAQLLMADCGMPATQHLLDDLRKRWKQAGGEGDPRAMLVDALTDLLTPLEKPFPERTETPFVVMIAGVNGAGKTTSIGKLAKHLQQSGASVLLAAGDTFRAAAREQLAIWGERNNVTVIQQAGGDPAAVMFDAVNAGKARGIDVVMCDTAGRLPTQLNLMDELKKAKRVIGKAMQGAPHETLLVLDGTTGQNALMQVKAFDEAIQLTGLVMTKLDGSAKGGVICAIAKERPVPLRFIGVGEGIDDLRPFSARDFAEAMV